MLLFAIGSQNFLKQAGREEVAVTALRRAVGEQRAPGFGAEQAAAIGRR